MTCMVRIAGTNTSTFDNSIPTVPYRSSKDVWFLYPHGCALVLGGTNRFIVVRLRLILIVPVTKSISPGKCAQFTVTNTCIYPSDLSACWAVKIPRLNLASWWRATVWKPWHFCIKRFLIAQLINFPYIFECIVKLILANGI